MVVWKVLQYGHSSSIYSITLSSASGLPMMWSTPGVYARTLAVLSPPLGAVFCIPAKNTAPAIKTPATTMVIGSTYWLFIWWLVYQFLKRKGMGERRGVSALLPPSHGLQPVAGFVAGERGAGKVGEFEPTAQNIFNFFQQVDAFYFREVARVILAEYRDIKVVGVVADDNVR